MTSAYLSGADLAGFGVPNATAAQIAQASTLIDNYLGRPEGLIWMPDAGGQPCYMAALSPMLTLTSVGAIAPGVNVVVAMNGPVTSLQVGDVLILDRANSAAVEAVSVAAVSGQTLTLSSVAYAHASSCTADWGLVIEEQKYLPEERPVTLMSRTPLLRVIVGVGRYAYGRRGDAANYQMDQFNLLAALSKFGGPPVWEIFQPTNLSIDIRTGQLWIPAGVMLAYYSEVKIRYVAGFQYTNLPAVVKNACATIIMALANNTQVGNVKSLKAGDTQLVRFTASLLDADTQLALNQYRVNSFK